ncbi:unnamed protein product [Meloidogyne enterolobii]|uniref:Uncharacterized protein n=1 Tax=Meloidogyne enterolobii TaxID=390850 RepID=A0ACB0XUQ2_MELEN
MAKESNHSQHAHNYAQLFLFYPYNFSFQFPFEGVHADKGDNLQFYLQDWNCLILEELNILSPSQVTKKLF